MSFSKVFKLSSLNLFLLCHLLASNTQIEEPSLQEKVGQLIITSFEGETLDSQVAQIFTRCNVGGVILYKKRNALVSYEIIRGVCEQINSLPLSSPAFIAVDQEGGRVQALVPGFKTMPAASVIAETMTPKQAEDFYYACALDLKAVGVNLNFSPVADVNTNPFNPIIGSRAFGNTALSVIPYAESVMAAHQKAGIGYCLKHFPGHGDTSVDSHLGLPCYDKSFLSLENEHIVVFQKLSPKADMIMTAHLLVPEVDKDHCVSCSPLFLKELLRKKYGFQGVIISDSLTMQGILVQHDNDIGKAAVSALKAGCDMLIIGGTVSKEEKFAITKLTQVYESLLKAIESGELQIKDIEASYQRVQKLKSKIIQKSS